jgi:hypothetical protein
MELAQRRQLLANALELIAQGPKMWDQPSMHHDLLAGAMRTHANPRIDIGDMPADMGSWTARTLLPHVVAALAQSDGAADHELAKEVMRLLKAAGPADDNRIEDYLSLVEPFCPDLPSA